MPKPETHIMFDSLQKVAEHTGQPVISFEHPSIDTPYQGVIVSSYVEVHAAAGDYGMLPGWYLIQGARGLFVAKPGDVDNKWTPSANGGQAAPAAVAADADVDGPEVDQVVLMADDYPDVPEDSPFVDYSVKDLKVALAEESKPVNGKKADLLARLHWLTHPLPAIEDD